MVIKKRHLLQISLRELQNDMILPSSEGGFSVAITVDGNICIGCTSLRKYMQKYINQWSKEKILHVDTKPA